MAPNTTALRAALKGDKVPDRQTKSALGAAVNKIASLTRRAERSKEAMTETGSAVIHTAETTGSLFLASLAEGYFGAHKLKLGSVDLRGTLAEKRAAPPPAPSTSASSAPPTSISTRPSPTAASVWTSATGSPRCSSSSRRSETAAPTSA